MSGVRGSRSMVAAYHKKNVDISQTIQSLFSKTNYDEEADASVT